MAANTEPDPVNCACRGETPDGAETAFFGSSSGYVFRLDAGTSFDGAVIDSFMTMTFTNQGSSRVYKAYRMASFELQGSGYAEFSMWYSLGYGSTNLEQGDLQSAVVTNLGSARWDVLHLQGVAADARHAIVRQPHRAATVAE
jgi:hypothetical protein